VTSREAIKKIVEDIPFTMGIPKKNGRRAEEKGKIEPSSLSPLYKDVFAGKGARRAARRRG